MVILDESNFFGVCRHLVMTSCLKSLFLASSGMFTYFEKQLLHIHPDSVNHSEVSLLRNYHNGSILHPQIPLGVEP